MFNLGADLYNYIRQIGETASEYVDPSIKAYISEIERNPGAFDALPPEAKDAVCTAYSTYGKDVPACKNWNPNTWARVLRSMRQQYSPDTQYTTVPTTPRVFSQKNLQAAKKPSGVEKFPGFQEKRHIALIGSTDSGKTTNMVSMMLKQNMFSFFDMFVLCASGLDGENMINFRKASLWNLMTRKKETTNAFAYFKNEQSQQCIDFVSDPNKRNQSKLVFFDDQQAISSKNIKTVGEFVMQAKNTNATLIVSLHQGYKQGPEKTLRDACQYLVIFNQTEDTFNRLLGLKIGNSLYKKYALISDKYKRVVIYNVTDRTLWYGTGDYARFDAVQPDSINM